MVQSQLDWEWALEHYDSIRVAQFMQDKYNTLNSNSELYL